MAENEQEYLPIFPLPLVLFPGMRLPLHIFETRYQTMITDVLANNQQFGVTLFLQTKQDNVGVTTAVGTLAKVIQVNEQEGGRLDIVTRGIERFKLIEIDNESQPYLQGIIETYTDLPETDADNTIDSDFLKEMKEKYKAMVRLSYKILKKNEDKAMEKIDNTNMSGEELSYRIGEHLNQNITVQQGFLELQSTRERLEREAEFMDPVISRLVAMTQINDAFSASEDRDDLTDESSSD